MTPATNTISTAHLYCDGASRANPGSAAAAFVLWSGDIEVQPDAELLASGGWPLGIRTNNFAEYFGAIWGMQNAVELGISNLTVHLDSKLVVEQMNGNWKVKSADLKPINEFAKSIAQHFDEITFKHIYREFNTRADAMGNLALDENKPVGSYELDLVIPDFELEAQGETKIAKTKPAKEATSQKLL